MKIALIGGLSRSERELVSVARRAGHELECHDGRVGGRGISELRAAVERADLVVIITGLTSHGSMYAAKRLARLLGREAIVVRKFGSARLQILLGEVSSRGGDRCRRLQAVA